jgi:anti-sigma factor RsiW
MTRTTGSEHPDLERLNDLLDHELDPREERRIQLHLADCADCRRSFEELSAIVALARELPAPEPPERVWQSISKSLSSPGASRHSRSWVYPALAVAATLVLGLSIWLMLRSSAPAPASTAAEQAALANMVTEELKAAEAHYDRAIVGLEQIIAQNQGVLPGEIATVLNQNLDLIENAISESRTAIATDPQSPVAQESLLSALRSKVALLQNTILLINEVRKGEGEAALDRIDEMRKSNTPGNPI